MEVAEKYYLITYQYTTKMGTQTLHNAIIDISPVSFLWNCQKEEKDCLYVLTFVIELSKEEALKYYDRIN